MNRWRRVVSLVLCICMMLSMVPMVRISADAAAVEAGDYDLTVYGDGEGFAMHDQQYTWGLAGTFAEWFGMTDYSRAYFRVTTGDCKANQVNVSRYIEFTQADYSPNISSGSLKNGVFTPNQGYWQPGESGTYKVWAYSSADKGYVDAYCKSFTVGVYYDVSVAIEGDPSGNGRVIIDGQEYKNGDILTMYNGVDYAVSAKYNSGYKVKSLSHTTAQGSRGLTIRLVYEPTVACTFEAGVSDHGRITIDGNSGTFEASAEMPVEIEVRANGASVAKTIDFGMGSMTMMVPGKVSGANYYDNKVTAVYVNGVKQENLTFEENGAVAKFTFQPSGTGTYVVTADYQVRELIADTSKVFTCLDNRSADTALELIEHIYGESLKNWPENERPKFSSGSITYFAGQRYSCGVGNMNWKNYDCWLTLGQALPANYQGMFGDADKFHDTSNPQPHRFGELTDASGTSTEQIRIQLGGAFGTMGMKVKVSRYGLETAEDIIITKSSNAYTDMISAIDAKFRGNSDCAFTYTDTEGNPVDYDAIMAAGSKLDVVVTYPGDSTYGPKSKTVTVNFRPTLDPQVVKGALIQKVYDGVPVTASAVKGELFDWFVRDEASTQVSLVYYDSEGNELAQAPTDAGVYSVRAKVTDCYGSEISRDAVTIQIAPADAVMAFALVPVKEYLRDERFDLEILSFNNTDVTSDAITYASADENVVTVDENGTVTIVGPGSTTITAALAATTNFGEVVQQIEIVVEKATPVFTLEELGELTYGQTAQLNITENTSDSTAAVSYSSDDYGIAYVDWYTGLVTPRQAGTVTLTARIPESDLYKEATASVTITINKAESQLEIPECDQVYDGQSAEVSVTTQDENSANVILEYKEAGQEDSAFTTDAPVNAGSYVVRATVMENSKFTEATVTAEFEILPREVTIQGARFEGGVNTYFREYDGTNQATVSEASLGNLCYTRVYNYSTYQYDYIADDVAVDLVSINACVDGSEPGSYEKVSLSNLTLTGEDAANYTIADTAELTLEYPLDYTIGEQYLPYTLEDQTIEVDGVFTDEYGYVQQGTYIVDGEAVEASELISQTAYTIDETYLAEGHYVSEVTLSVENRTILLNAVVLDAEGNDVTYCYNLFGHVGSLAIAIDCPDHGFDDNGFCANCVSYEPAPGTADEFGTVTYDIYNAGQLFWFAQQINEVDGSSRARLMNNIDLNPGYTFNEDGTATYEGETVTSGWRGWTPIGSDPEGGMVIFSGAFDGQGYSVSGVYINDENMDRAGFFGWIDYVPEVTDMHLTNSYIRGNEYVGAFAGYFYAIMEKCTVDSSVTVVGNRIVGGFAGYAGSGYINNCASAANVIALGEDAEAAGLVGHSSLSIYNSYCTNGEIVSSQNESYGTIENCYYLVADDATEEEKTDSYDGTTAVTAAQLASGEVAWLLQEGQNSETMLMSDDDTTSGYSQVWGQNVDMSGFTEFDPLPVLNGPKVYFGYEGCSDGTYSNTELDTEQDEHIYKEAWSHDSGYHWHDCTGCTGKTDLGEHSFDENGECSVCGRGENETDAAITTLGASLKLEDEVSVNVFFALENLEVGTERMGMLAWDSEPDSPSYDNAQYRYTGVVAETDRYKVTTDPIAAKNMGDTKYYVVYAQQPDGSYVYSDVVAYSPRVYAMNRLEKSTNEKTRALCVTLLNYGAEAQKYFASQSDYSYTELMNAGLTDAQKALVKDYSSDMVTAGETVSAAKAGVFAETADAFTRRGANITLGGALALNFVFKPSVTVENMRLYYWSAEDYEKLSVLTEENATGVIEMTATGDEFKCKFKDIAAKEMDNLIYIGAVYEADGQTWCSGIRPYSISIYCARKAADASSAVQELAKATAVYGYYANDYFS